jgi:hypothetical protein
MSLKSIIFALSLAVALFPLPAPASNLPGPNERPSPSTYFSRQFAQATYCNGPGSQTYSVGARACFCGQRVWWVCTSNQGPGSSGSWLVTNQPCSPPC